MTKSIKRLIVCLGILLGAGGIMMWNVSQHSSFAKADPQVQKVADSNLVRLNLAISAYKGVPLTTSDSPWKLFHGLLGHSTDFDIVDKDETNQRCVHWLLQVASWKGTYKGVSITRDGQWGPSFVHAPNPLKMMEFEDHYCQFLYKLWISGADPDQTVILLPPEGKRITLREMVRAEQRQCHGIEDVSWAIPVFARWGDSDWTTRFGEKYNLERLVRQHLAREAECNACFNTHWKMALAWIVRESGLDLPSSLRGRAQSRLVELINEAHANLDPSGHFPVPGAISPLGNQSTAGQSESDDSIWLAYQGHMLEWLLVALPDTDFRQHEWVHRAVAAMIERLEHLPKDMNYGGYSHCAHALSLYEKRSKFLNLTALNGTVR